MNQLKHNTEKVSVTNSGDLIEIQHVSYYKFLYEDLKKEFRIFPNPLNFKYDRKKHKNINITGNEIDQLIKRAKNFSNGKIKARPFFYLNKKKTEKFIESLFTINFKKVKKKKELIIKKIYLNFSDIKLLPSKESFVDVITRELTYQVYVFTGSYIYWNVPTEKKNAFGVLLLKKLKKILFPPKQLANFQLFFELKQNDHNKFYKVSRQIYFKNKNSKLLLALKFLRSSFAKQNLDDFKSVGYSTESLPCYIFSLPLMTQDGTFYVNGCERVAISQIIKSPGVYFSKGFEKNNIWYEATLISENSIWTKFKLNENIKSPSTREIFATFGPSFGENPLSFELLEFLPYLGMSVHELEENLDYPQFHESFSHKKLLEIRTWAFYTKNFLISSIKKWQRTLKDAIIEEKSEAAIRKISEKLKRVQKLLEDLPYLSTQLYRIELEKLQLSEGYDDDSAFKMDILMKYIEEIGAFSIGEIGRSHLNGKFGIHLPKHVTYITAFDIIGIINGLIGLKMGKILSDDIDHLKNKHIRPIGDLIKFQLHALLARESLNRLEGLHIDIGIGNQEIEYHTGLIDKNEYLAHLYNLSNDFSAFIMSGKMKNTFERTARELFTLSPLAQYFDQVNPLAELSHKRKISVFGPNGLKRTSNVSSKMRDIHPSQYGKLCPIETPEGENAGLVMTLANYARLNQDGAIETPYYLAKDSFVFSNKIPIYLNVEQEANAKVVFFSTFVRTNKKIADRFVSTKEESIFSLAKSKDINYFSLSPFQVISVGTSLIPFLEHDDANRALMGSNMQRQALPLVYPEKPIIGTGFEMNIPMESGLVIKSYSEGKILIASSRLIQIEDKNNQVLSYLLKNYIRSNQKTAIVQKPIYRCGEKIFSGQIIADGPATFEGELALGSNLLIGYLPWDGLNYEDAIIINENLGIHNILSSVHIVEQETSLAFSLDSIMSERLLNNFLDERTEKFFSYLDLWLGKNDEEFSLITYLENFTNLRLENPNITRDKLIQKRGLEGDPYLINMWDLIETMDINDVKKMINFKKAFKQFCDQEKISIFPLIHFLQNTSLSNLVSFNAYLRKYGKEGKRLFLKQLKKSLKQFCINKLNWLVQKDFRQKITSSYSKKKLQKTLKYEFFEQLVDKLFTQLCIQIERENDAKIIDKKFEEEALIFELTKEMLEEEFELQLSQFTNLLTKKNFLKKQIRHRKLQRFYLVKKKYRQQELKTEFIRSSIPELSGFKEMSEQFYLPNSFRINNNLDENGIVKLGAYVVEGDPLVGKITFIEKLSTPLEGFKNLMDVIDNTALAHIKDLSLTVDSEAEGRIVDIAFIPENKEIRDSYSKVKISIASLRKIEIGDKLSGRHGNKGVIARIASRADMPILPDGTTLDILVNPLGVPSRMNVGQILECLLGFAGNYLEKRFKITPFDEIYGKNASAILVHEKLKQARSYTSIDWLLNPAYPGKVFLRDGRTGEYFDNPTTIGYAYILKLVHTVESKLHSRNIGPYNKITQQPLGGRSRDGGQRLGEMEVWALEAHGCSHTLQELLTIKSDDIESRVELDNYLLSGRHYQKPMAKLPETFSLMIHELNSLGLNIEFYKHNTQYSSNIVNEKINNIRKQETKFVQPLDNQKDRKMEVQIFLLLEKRLKIKSILDLINEGIKLKKTRFYDSFQEKVLTNAENYLQKNLFDKFLLYFDKIN